MSTHPYGRLTRRGMAGLVGLGFLEMALPGEAYAEYAREEPAFRVHTRSDWKARRPRRPAKVLATPPDRIVVHHTATTNSDDLSIGHAYRLSRRIQRFHMRAHGWDDTGQQLTISRGGHVMEGRNRSLDSIRTGRHVVGAHALHHNRHTIGIENEGTYSTSSVPTRLWCSLVETCVWLCVAYDLEPVEAIVGHRDLSATECPGDVLYARLSELRAEVAVHLATSSGGQESGGEGSGGEGAGEVTPPPAGPSPSQPTPTPTTEVTPEPSTQAPAPERTGQDSGVV